MNHFRAQSILAQGRSIKDLFSLNLRVHIKEEAKVEDDGDLVDLTRE